MMFHALRGLGQSTPVYNQDAFGTWCSQNPVTASISSIFPELAILAGAPANNVGYSCAADLMEGGMTSTVQTPISPTITGGYNAGSTSMPPDQATIDAQDPTTTINQILADTQSNAVANATAAAAAQAAANAAANPCVSNPTFSCWWQQNSEMVLIGGAIFIGLFALSTLKKK